MLRRSHMLPEKQRDRRLAFGTFIIDLDARQLFDERMATVKLTSGEFDILACFVQRPRRVLTRDQILDLARGRATGPFDRTIDTLISRLRRKLEAASPGSNLIATVRNGGYLFTTHVRQLT